MRRKYNRKTWKEKFVSWRSIQLIAFIDIVGILIASIPIILPVAKNFLEKL